MLSGASLRLRIKSSISSREKVSAGGVVAVVAFGASMVKVSGVGGLNG
jgi:hypothetical protein